MDREKIKNISVIIAVSSAVICMLSIFFSYRVYVSSKKLVTEYRDDLSAFMRKGDDVKEYYSMLSENDKFSNIVTDRGTEAMPNLENYLAYSYIQEGRVEDALVFIGSLERKYANSFVLTRGADRRLKWIPASQAAENLRKLIE